ncbi:MAG TPA: thiamine phosphate synthase [Gemmatimonadaceae bacterium]|nr:thiamine phosphate synthase [Gemmatimonadaceae bacterium]
MPIRQPDLRTPDAVPRVHVVTTDEVVTRADFIDVACGVMGVLGPRGALHLRANRATGARLQALGESLSAAQRVTGAWLVVNDRVDVALVVRARGAQLTSHSLTAADARRAAPALAIGASVHGVAEGVEAAQDGADWLVAGRVFAPVTHPGEDGRGMEFVEGLVAAVRVPVIAIGGVRPKHCRALRLAGVHGIAVIRGIWDAPNAERAASDYLSCYEDAGVA